MPNDKKRKRKITRRKKKEEGRRIRKDGGDVPFFQCKVERSRASESVSYKNQCILLGREWEGERGGDRRKEERRERI